MPSPRAFKLPPAAFEDLATVLQHHDKLADLLAASSALDAAPTLEAATQAVSERLGGPMDQMRRLVKAMLALHGLRRELDLSPDDTVDLVTRCLTQYAPESWNADDTGRWIGASPTLAALLDPDNPLAVHEKAERLTYSHDRLLERAVVFTDIRPVFNESATTILRTSVSHVLQLAYFDGTGTRRLSVALDDADLAMLGRQCDRALKKSTAVVNACEAAKPLFGRGWRDASND